MTIHGEVLIQAIESGTTFSSDGDSHTLNSGIASEALSKIQELIENYPVKNTLEIGMAMGMSTLGILYALEKKNGGSHTAIDPFQRKPAEYFDPAIQDTSKNGWAGIGLNMVERAGLSHRFQLVEEPSYIALPRLVEQGKKFDLIFIDGYHTFDFTFIDYFYSDLLLSEGGLLIFDDVLLPMVHKVCWFVETHKDYKKLGPEMTHPLNPAFRAVMRVQQVIGQRAPRNAHKEWGSIIAYEKRSSTIVRPLYFHTNFYPYFKIWWSLKRLRGVLSGSGVPKAPSRFEKPRND